MTTTFRVVFSGSPLPGTDRDTAIRNFAQLFKRSPEQAAGAFNGKPVVIKKGLSEADAEKYCRVLEKAGLSALSEPEAGMASAQPGHVTTEQAPARSAGGVSLSIMEEHAPVATTPVVEKPVVAAPKFSSSLSLLDTEPHGDASSTGSGAPSRMTCPSCGREQAKADVCEACHLVIAKFRARKQEAVATPANVETETDSAEGGGDEAKPSFFGKLFGKLKGN